MTAADQHRAYGDANRDLTYTVSGGGLVNGDVLSGTLARDPGETPGDYTIGKAV